MQYGKKNAERKETCRKVRKRLWTVSAFFTDFIKTLEIRQTLITIIGYSIYILRITLFLRQTSFLSLKIKQTPLSSGKISEKTAVFVLLKRFRTGTETGYSVIKGKKAGKGKTQNKNREKGKRINIKIGKYMNHKNKNGK